MKLVIDRAKWLRGEKDAGLLLRESDGKMCCLGFLALACGLEEDQIVEVGEPHETRSPLLPKWLCSAYDEHEDDGELVTKYIDSSDAVELMKINDTVGDDAPREREIASVFAKHGVEVEFVG